MELNNIKSTDNWGTTTENLNSNFQKTSVEIEKIRYLTSNSKGLYANVEALRAAVPNPRNGDWAIVGTTVPGPLWAAANGVWTATGETGGVGNVDLAGYATSSDLQAVRTTADNSKLESADAKRTATEALSKATTATEAAGEAADSANSAISQAEQAKTAAEQANITANNAATNATTAINATNAFGVELNDSRTLVNINKLFADVTYTLTTAIAAITEPIRKRGLVITYRTDKGFETKQFIGTVDVFNNEELWKDFGSGSGAGNVFNVTELVPQQEYYTLATAIAAIPVEIQCKGLVVTFESAQGKWLSYQFIGTSLDAFATAASWVEFGGAGSVKLVALNGVDHAPDEEGKIALTVDQIQVDETLTSTGTNPVQGKAVYAAVEGIEAGAALLLNTIGEGDEKAFSLSLLDKKGEVLSTTETFAGGGGGGAVATTKIVLTRITDNLTVKTGEEVKLQFIYDQIDTTSGTTTGNPANAVITITRGATTSTLNQTLAAGSTTTLDVSKYIGVGNNTIKARVTVGEGVEQQVSTVAWNVNAVELKLSSAFNIATVINRGDRVSIPFSLQGSGSKTLRMYVDCVATEDRTIGTSSSNGSFTIDTTHMTHGAHSIQLVAELELPDGKKILSNSMYLDIAVRAGGDSPIIATRFDYPDGAIIGAGERPYIPVRQYDEYTLTYAAYNPKETPSKVDLFEAGNLVSSSMVMFVRNTIKLRAMNSGEISCKMTCGTLQYTYGLSISKSELNLTEPVDNMVLKLSAIGRSNNDINRLEWKYQDVQTKLEGFKFGGDGWLDGALRLTGTARATVQLMPLKAPIQNVTNAFSFSIRLKVSDVMNEQAEIVRCVDSDGTGFVITTQEARMMTRGNSQVAMKFDTNEVYNIGFVSHPEAVPESTDYAKTNSSMVYLYINGKQSGSVQRGSSDSIYQVNPQYISIGSSDCTVDVYSMRSYTVALTDAQMLDAYIVDFNTADELINAYNRNNVLDGNGQITVESLPADMPYMIITGVQPNGVSTFIHAAITNNKSMKYDVDQILFVNHSKPYQNWVLTGGCISLQGTSSLAYPIKNYREYLYNSLKVPGIMYLGCDAQGIGGTLQEAPKYSLVMAEQNAGKISAPVNCFCAKADYAESSSSHNTGMARLVNDVLTDCGILTPAQRHVDKARYPYDVRTTVDGHPIMMFYRNTVNDTPVFGGKYNLNNDKSTEAVFGFTGIPGYHDNDWLQTKFGGKNPTECWEFLNNDYPMGSFLDDDFDAKGEDGTFNWLKVFEARYPDDKVANAAYAAGTRKPEHLMRLVKWLKSTQGNPAKFKAEMADYFDVEYLCSYYMFTEIMGCVDQRVKNMTFGFWYDPIANKMLCYPIFYDCDTILGVRNDSRLKYGPFIDHNTIDPELSTAEKTVYAYAGHDSVLWINLRDQCKPELDAVYKKLRAKMTNDTIFNMFDKEQSSKFCERIYNIDALYKYVYPKTRGVEVLQNGQVTNLTYSYLEAMQGSRTSHRHWWVNNRMSLFDARYMTGQYLSTDLTFKGNSAAGATIKATPIRDFYFAFYREGAVMTHVPVAAEQEWSYTYDNMANIGTIFHFYGGQYVRKLNLSLWGGFTDMNLPYMPKLQELTLGVDGKEYLLSELSIGTKMPMLTKLMMRNYTRIPALDLSRSALLQSFDGKGCSALSVVSFADGAPINSIYYPLNYQTVKLRYLPELKRSGITFENINSVTGLWFDSCAQIDGLSLFNELFALGKLKHVRLTGVNIEGTGSDLAAWYNANLGGIDAAGNTVGKCKLIGTYKLTKYLDEATFARYVDHFDELNIRQPQYTMVEFDDAVADDRNVSNLDNNTGYKFGNDYKPNAHISAMLAKRFRCLGKQGSEGQMTIYPLHYANSNFYADTEDVTACTPALLNGTQGDAFVFEPKYWYKGINDFLNKKHYSCYSSNSDMPDKPVAKVITYAELLAQGSVKLSYKLMTSKTDVASSLSADTKYSVIEVDVSQHKRVRFPTSALTLMASGLFADSSGKILRTLAISTLELKFEDGMYLIADVPQGAMKLHFTILKEAEFDCVVLSNSTRIEDMEPDWCLHEECLVGLFESSVVDSKLRSCITGGSSSGNLSWTDFNYYSALRKMQQIDYEMHKHIANLFFVTYGRRDSQAQCGAGSHTYSRITGGSSAYGMVDTIGFDAAKQIDSTLTPALVDGLNPQYSWYKVMVDGVATIVRRDNSCCLGYEDIYGNKYEMMDNVSLPNNSGNVYKWLITMPDGSQRKVKGSSFNDMWIKDVAHGKYMDVVPIGNTSGSHSTHYCDKFLVSSGASRVVFRSCSSAGASGGVSGANANSDSSYASADRGSRLAFRRQIVKAQSVAAYKAVVEIA